MNKPILILIGGGSCSGKTTIANKLKNDFFPDCSLIINYDDYYKNQDHLTFKQRQKTNYDIPSALDNELLIHDLDELLNNKPVYKPIYDFVNHTRKKDKNLIYPQKIIILEGLFALYDKSIISQASLTIFVESTSTLRLERKINRDFYERGRSKEESTSQFFNVSDPMYKIYTEPTKSNASIILNGENYTNQDIENLALIIIKKLKSLE